MSARRGCCPTRFRPPTAPRRCSSACSASPAARRCAPQPVDIGALAVGHARPDRQLGRTDDRGAASRCDADLPSALVDPNQLELAILNLTRQRARRHAATADR